MRIAHIVSHAVQEGTANATLVTRGGVAQYVTITEHTEYAEVLAKATTDAALHLGGITSVLSVYIEADQNIIVKLAATTAAAAINVKANFPLALVLSAGVAAIYVTNPSSTDDANLKVVLGG